MVYIIQAHKNQRQLLRLINVLNDSDVSFYIHIDLKSEIEKFSSVISGENIVFIKERVDCIWGDFSQVRATLNLLENVFKKNYPDDTRVTFLSGQDYPIKSGTHIKNFFHSHQKTDFITVEGISESGSHHLKNFKAFKVNHSSKRHDFSMISVNHYKSMIKNVFLGKLLLGELKYIFKVKKLPLNLQAYRGSNWWSLRYRTLKDLIEFYDDNKFILDEFYTKTFCADESFFQTIIMHLEEKNKSLHIERSVTYDNWIRPGVELPVTFTSKDQAELFLQPESKLFARKFDDELDEKILDELDKII